MCIGHDIYLRLVGGAFWLFQANSLFTKIERRLPRRMIQKIRIEDLALEVLRAKAVDIRDVDAGEKPFLYSSGNWGPGYVSIKNLVGRKELIKTLTEQLALRVAAAAPHIHVVAGNATGGMIPGWNASEFLGEALKRTIPFVYVRETRKKGGHNERITGIANNPEISLGDNVLVVEELVNFSQTTCISADALREAGFAVTHAACILSYENPEALRALSEHKLTMIHLMTLGDVLNAAQKHQTHPRKAIEAYREFLCDPTAWQKRHGLVAVPEGGTK